VGLSHGHKLLQVRLAPVLLAYGLLQGADVVHERAYSIGWGPIHKWEWRFALQCALGRPYESAEPSRGPGEFGHPAAHLRVRDAPGCLILRSTFLPRILGALLVLAGIGWIAYLSPVVANALSNWIKGLGILAEASLMLWLVARGVNERRWQEQAGKKAPQ
jgi:hypothetical protein